MENTVYKTINAVHADLCKVGISKDDTNKFDKYKFRGIDSVYNAVSPILAKNGLMILQRVLSCNTTERSTAKGGITFCSVVDVEFDLINNDGSKHTIKTYGEGMDRGDKSINKALTAAYKYALFQAFCIPTESTDPDHDTHSVEIVKTLPELTTTHNKWEAAKAAYKRDGNLIAVKQRMSISQENEMQLVKECVDEVEYENGCENDQAQLEHQCSE